MAISTIWLARALAPDGRLISLEADPEPAEVAKKNVALAGLDDVVEVRPGRALDTLPQIATEGVAPFDLVFIDADKRNNPGYFEWALKLSRAGALIIVDNIVRHGGLVDLDNHEEDMDGTRRLFEIVSDDSQVDATGGQTVGSKGHDGFLLALVTGDVNGGVHS